MPAYYSEHVIQLSTKVSPTYLRLARPLHNFHTNTFLECLPLFPSKLSNELQSETKYHTQEHNYCIFFDGTTSVLKMSQKWGHRPTSYGQRKWANNKLSVAIIITISNWSRRTSFISGSMVKERKLQMICNFF